jgi:FtsH-binding integral membrane protein
VITDDPSPVGRDPRPLGSLYWLLAAGVLPAVNVAAYWVGADWLHQGRDVGTPVFVVLLVVECFGLVMFLRGRGELSGARVLVTIVSLLVMSAVLVFIASGVALAMAGDTT